MAAQDNVFLLATGMVSYSRRPQSGQITCYLNRTYHVLLTRLILIVALRFEV